MSPIDETAGTAAMARPSVVDIFRYPVKGMSPERLESVTVEAGDTIPYDRAYAIENGPGRFDPLAPKHLPKINFLMLMRDERLATLRTEFDDLNQTLSIYRDGAKVASGQLSTPVGRQLIEQFLSSYFSKELRGAPRIAHAKGHSFSDVPEKCVHIVNLASIRELERIAYRPIDPLRFRANLYIDGAEPWAESEWVGRDIQVGPISLHVFERTERCDATNVDPATAEHDMSIPSLLQRRWGHSNFGVYAKVTGSGRITVGDSVTES